LYLAEEDAVICSEWRWDY